MENMYCVYQVRNTSGSVGDNMYCVYQVRNTSGSVGTQAAGECFHSFFKFSQTSISVSVMKNMFSILENINEEKGKHLFTFIIKR